MVAGFRRGFMTEYGRSPATTKTSTMGAFYGRAGVPAMTCPHVEERESAALCNTGQATVTATGLPIRGRNHDSRVREGEMGGIGIPSSAQPMSTAGWDRPPAPEARQQTVLHAAKHTRAFLNRL